MNKAVFSKCQLDLIKAVKNDSNFSADDLLQWYSSKNNIKKEFAKWSHVFLDIVQILSKIQAEKYISKGVDKSRFIADINTGWESLIYNTVGTDAINAGPVPWEPTGEFLSTFYQRMSFFVIQSIADCKVEYIPGYLTN